MADAFSIKSKGGNVFMRSMRSQSIGSQLADKVKNKLENPIIFKPLKGDRTHGLEADILVDVCTAILGAKLSPQQENIAAQAHIILNAFAKVGITALVDLED